jgi:excisionase family DNA binding protein
MFSLPVGRLSHVADFASAIMDNRHSTFGSPRDPLSRIVEDDKNNASITVAIPEAIVQEITRRVVEQIVAQSGEESEPWLTVDQAARHLGCGTRRIYDLTRQGALPHAKDGRRTLFRRVDLDSFVRAGGATREKYPGLRAEVSSMVESDKKVGRRCSEHPAPRQRRY